jgi:small-conductance mechanosensitive channel
VYGPSAMGKLLHDLPLLPVAAFYLLVALFGGVITRNTIHRTLERTSGQMGPSLHRVLSHALPRPAGLAVFLLFASMALRFLPIPPSIETLTKHDIPFVLGTVGVMVLMRASLSAITAYGETFPQLKSTAGMARAITWILGLALIAVLLSDALGISLAPALTALGVGSLSVALALQDTLSNFFAGVYLLLDKPILPGDFVRLDGGNEGYVETIGWRSTHLRTLAPSLIIVPNATLSKSIITNFRRTNPRLLLATPIEVSLEADPDKVGALLGEEMKRATEIAGVDANQGPFVRFALGDRGLIFTLYVTIVATADGGLVQQELRKRAISRLRRDGVELAPPNPFVKKG